MRSLQLSRSDAARLLLLGQGLLDDPSGPASHSRVLSVIERLGFVQVDSINTLERAHHLTLHARLDGYRRPALASLLERERSLFEQWTHDASAIPVRWYRHWHPRFESAGKRIRGNAWWRERMGPRPNRVLEAVLARVRTEGPLQSRDFERPPSPRGGPTAGQGWWNWSPNKAALEFLWRTGSLAVARRENFEKVYDLSERVHPEHHASTRPAHAELVDWACRAALERVGVATPRELAAFWHAVPLVDARRWCLAAAARGEVVPASVEAHDGSRRDAFAIADWRERLASAPAAPARLRPLSPFDPVVRDRDRALRLFGFDYRFEAFVPAAKRRFGYYVLPLLEGERFAGRLSARHDRPARRLVVDGLWWEPGVKATPGRRAALGAALERLAELVGASEVVGGGVEGLVARGRRTDAAPPPRGRPQERTPASKTPADRSPPARMPPGRTKAPPSG